MIVNTRVLYDGPRNFVVRRSGRQDASGLQEVLSPVWDVAAMRPPAGPALAIERIQFTVLGGIVTLFWDTGDPASAVEFLDLQLAETLDLKRWGGMRASANTVGASVVPTGNVLLSTFGFDSGSSYSLVVECIKGVGSPTG